MKLFEGKSPAEKNKIIAAMVLGGMAVLTIGYNIIGLYNPGRKTSVTVTASPTPTTSPKTSSDVAALPNNEEVNFEYTTTPVNYEPGAFYAPDAGRNIFAFYEPPPPTPYVAPSVVVKPPTPIPPPPPTPTPPLLIGFVTPQEVYAGSKTFRLEVSGDKFTPDSVILFNGSQLPTTYISPQQLVAEIPSNLISGEGPKQIMVVTPNGKLYSNQVLLNVQPQPKPPLLYIGAKLSQRNNNNTAYFREKDKNMEFGARLNDTVSGRFRVISISKEDVILEDASLGFRHRLPLYRPEPGQSASVNVPSLNSPDGFRNKGMNNQYNPNQPVYIPPQGEIQGIPGIPGTIQRQNVPQPPPPNKDDDDDDNN
jgi:hypothetical protein